MILEFAKDQYVNVDDISALRWFEEEDRSYGMILINGEKIAVKEKEEFDVIKNAFTWLHKSHMVDDEMKKIKLVRREED